MATEGLTSGSGLLKAAFVLASEIVVNAWMHFSVSGIAFSASVAAALGMTAGVAQAGSLATAAAIPGAAASSVVPDMVFE